MKRIADFLIRVLHHEHGQSLAIMAGAMVALVALTGLATDGGYAYVQRRVVQNATEAASLAGANVLAEEGEWVKNAGFTVTRPEEKEILKQALASAEVNGVPDSAPADDYTNENITVHYVNLDGSRGAQLGNNLLMPGVAGIEVRSELPFETFFIRLIGFEKLRADAVTRATLLSVGSTSYGFPLTIKDTEAEACEQSGEPCRLFDHKDKKRGPGNWSWLDIIGGDNGGGTNELREVIRNQNGNLKVDAWSRSETGTICAAQDEVSKLVNKNAVVVIPIFDRTNDAGGTNLEYHIVKLAAFKLTANSCNGQPKYIEGEFVQWVDSRADADPNADDTGLHTIKLSAP